jgi:catechol 2,3-dioxygenase-like lactoylglutathione lyase family enzyme
MKLEALDHVGVLVSDIDRSIDWYQRVLGLERAYEDISGSSPAVLVTNGTGVALFSAEGEPARLAASRPAEHVCFRLPALAYESARAELEAAGIEYREFDHRVARSLYIRDPDSQVIEITAYQVPSATPADCKVED